MMTDEEQRTKDEYLRRGFRVHDSGLGHIGRMLDTLFEKDALGDARFGNGNAYVNDTALPNGMKMLVRSKHAVEVPTSLDQRVIITFWTVEGFPPTEFGAANSDVVFAFFDTLIETKGNLNAAVAVARALEQDALDRHTAEVNRPRNDAEAAVIAEFATHGYVIKHFGPVRALVKDFEGGWVGVTKPAPDYKRGDLPQSMDEEVETAIRLHGQRTDATAVSAAVNSHAAIEAGDAAIEEYRKQGIGSKLPKGVMVS